MNIIVIHFLIQVHRSPRPPNYNNNFEVCELEVHRIPTRLALTEPWGELILKGDTKEKQLPAKEYKEKEFRGGKKKSR